jgi:hypothetical protein
MSLGGTAARLNALKDTGSGRRVERGISDEVVEAVPQQIRPWSRKLAASRTAVRDVHHSTS